MKAFMNNTTTGRGIKDGTHTGEGGRSLRMCGMFSRYMNADATGSRNERKKLYR